MSRKMKNMKITNFFKIKNSKSKKPKKKTPKSLPKSKPKKNEKSSNSSSSKKKKTHKKKRKKVTPSIEIKIPIVENEKLNNEIFDEFYLTNNEPQPQPPSLSQKKHSKLRKKSSLSPKQENDEFQFDDEDDDENGTINRKRKRGDGDGEEEDEDDGDGEDGSESDEEPKEKKIKLLSFMYNEQNENENDDDDDDDLLEDDEEDEKEKKKEKLRKKEFLKILQLRKEGKLQSPYSSNGINLGFEKKKKKEKVKKGENIKYTPFEKQVLKLKEKYKGLVLVIENGYKFCLLGKDASLGRSVLGIGCFQKKNFQWSSFPTCRLMYYVKKLVNHGEKVGVIRQKETAAIRAAGKGKQKKVFIRELDKIYTHGTFISDEKLDGDETGLNNENDCYIMAIYEEQNKRNNSIRIGIVATEVSTGQVIWDLFVEGTGFMRRELHSRLIALKPVEILTMERGKLSNETEKMISSMSFITRIERVKFNKSNDDGDVDIVMSTDELEKLPEQIKMCINHLNDYLKTFQLSQLINLSNPIHLQSRKDHMILNGITLWNLEVLQSHDFNDVDGSLFGFLNNTKTQFGKRLLKRWICNPLRNKKEINKRLDSITYLKKLNVVEPLVKFMNVLKKLPDFERLFLKVIYSRIKPSVMLSTLELLTNLFIEIHKIKQLEINDELLNETISKIPYQDFQPIVDKMLSKFSDESAKKDDFYGLFFEDGVIIDDGHTSIQDHYSKIEEIGADLEDHLEEIKEEIDCRNVEYKSVNNNDYLVVIDNDVVKEIDVPNDWDIFNKLKKQTRFTTKTTRNLTQLLSFHKEHIIKLSRTVWGDMLKEFSKSYPIMRELVNQLSVLDCLFSLSIVSSEPNYVRPDIITDRRILNVKNGRHPIVESFMDNFVPNDVELDQNKIESFIVTGPNMGGKSVYIKMIALIALMAQIGCYVPADSCKISPLDKILTRMGAYDDISSGSSTFFIEASEASQILNHSTENSLVILDELGRGTSTYDGTSIAYSTLEYLLGKHCFTLFVTHYPEITKLETLNSNCKNVHMSYFQVDNGRNITFKYEVANGTSGSSYGINVGRIAGLPESIIEDAQKKSDELKGIAKNNVQNGQFCEILNFDDENDIDDLLNFQKEVKFLKDNINFV